MINLSPRTFSSAKYARLGRILSKRLIPDTLRKTLPSCITASCPGLDRRSPVWDIAASSELRSRTTSRTYQAVKRCLCALTPMFIGKQGLQSRQS